MIIRLEKAIGHANCGCCGMMFEVRGMFNGWIGLLCRQCLADTKIS